MKLATVVMCCALISIPFAGASGMPAPTDVASPEVNVPEWHSLTVGQVVGHATPTLAADGTASCAFGAGQASIAFTPDEVKAFDAAGVKSVTRSIRLGVDPTDPCSLIVISKTETPAAAPSVTPPNIPGLSDSGTTSSPEGEIGASSICKSLKTVLTARPAYGGSDYLTETMVKANYCYDPGYIWMNSFDWWCKANGWHAFALDECYNGEVVWSGSNYIRATKIGHYHQNPFNTFNHYLQAKSTAYASGITVCNYNWWGSTPSNLDNECTLS